MEENKLKQVKKYIESTMLMKTILYDKIPKLIERELEKNDISNLMEIELSLKINMKEVM